MKKKTMSSRNSSSPMSYLLSAALVLSGQVYPSAAMAEELGNCKAGTDASTNPCENATDSLSAKATSQGKRSSGGSKYRGTDFFVSCQGQSNVSWEKMSPRSAENWEGEWKALYQGSYDQNLKEALANFEGAITSYDTAAAAAADLSQARGEVQKMAIEYLKGHYEVMMDILKGRNELKECQGLSGLTRLLSSSDYEEAKSWGESTTKTSVDGKIKCKAVGAETQDYKPCLNAINAYDALFVADQGVQVFQQVSYMDKTMDIQQKLSEESTNVTAGMEAQKSNLEAQADIANQKAAFDGAKAATLAGFLSSMPSLESLTEQCNSEISDSLNNIDQYSDVLIDHLQKLFEEKASKHFLKGGIRLAKGGDIQNFADVEQALEQVEGYTQQTSTQPSTALEITYSKFTTPSNPSNSAAEICDEVGSQKNVALIMNDEARQAMKAAMIAAGIDAAGNLAKAAILNKYAGQIGDAMKDVESIAPPEFGGVFEDGLFDQCSADPDSEECAVQLSGQDVGFQGNSISIGGFERGVVGGASGGDIAAAANPDAPSSVARSGNSAPKIGTGIGKADKGGGIIGSAPKATLGAGGGGSGGGGGGGGAPSSVSGSPGGGVPGGNGDPQAAATGNGSKMSFAGGMKPSSLSGGRGAAAKKEKRVDNPFDKLFGKKGAGGNELSFRNPAAIGKGKGSVLDQISRRYTEISKTDRLLKYEKK